MAIYFVSDFHIGAPWIEDEEKRIGLFANFVNIIKPSAEYLYIIGDLFDFWFEYRDGFPNRFPAVTSGLKKLTDAGVKVIFIGGNHDWWAGKTFIELTGAETVKTDIEVSHFEKKIFIGHGDGIAKADWPYRILRRILRNRLNIWLFSQLPSSAGIKFAGLVSSSSRSIGYARQWQFIGEYEAYARKLISKGLDAVLLGHTHIPYKKELEGGVYYNTGDWISYFTYVVLNERGFRLKTFKNGVEEDFDISGLSPPEKFVK